MTQQLKRPQAKANNHPIPTPSGSGLKHTHRVKRINKCLTMVALMSMTAPSIAAQQGFHGDIGIYLGMSSTNSSLSTEQEAIQSQLTGEQTTQEEALVIPMWNISYTKNTHSLYYKTDIISMAKDFYSQLGYRYEINDSSSISLGYIPGLLTKEVWNDPYATQTDRVKTDLNFDGWVMDWKNFMDTGYSLQLATGSIDIEDEMSGQQTLPPLSQVELDRQGQVYYGAISRSISLVDNIQLEWQLDYLQSDLDGKAKENQGIGGETEVSINNGRHITQLGLSINSRNYETAHPIFNKTRQDTDLGLSATYIYAAPFDWQQTALVARAGWDTTESNIDFYDSEQWLLTVGINHRF